MVPVIEVSVVEERIKPNKDPTCTATSRTSTYRQYLKELKVITQQVVPLILTEGSQCLTSSVALMFCGRMSKLEFGGAVLANTFIGIFGSSVAFGLSTACDTLFAQIFGSALKKRLGVVLIRSLIILGLSSLIPMAIFINAEHILSWFGQDPEAARLAADYLLIFCPGLLGLFSCLPLSKYLQSQNMILPPMFIGLLSNGINVGLHFLFIEYAGYGLAGSATAQAATYIGYSCLTIGYILVFKVHRDTWTGWSVECLLDWAQWFSLAWFGLVITCTEWWSCEASLFVAGLIGTTELACQSVLMQISMLPFTLYAGFGRNVSIRVGQYLGANDVKGAMRSYRLVLGICCLLSCFLAAMVYVFRQGVPKIFTDIPEVVTMTTEVLPWHVLYLVFDGAYVACDGILRGSGRQNVGAVVTFVCCLIALLIAVPLMLSYRSVAEFWKAMAAALAADAVLLGLICACTNWEKQARIATERVTIAAEKKADSTERMSLRIYLRTSVAVLAALCVLIISILIRVYFPHPKHVTYPDHYNTTRVYDDV